MIIRNTNRSRAILITALLLTIPGCMLQQRKPGRMGHDMGLPDIMKTSPVVDEAGSGTLESVDQMIEELVTDLSNQRLDIATVAVWKLRAQPGEDHGETVRQKLIAQLVASGSVTVVTRERLQELLKEQGLSETGTIDEATAIEIGALIGVDGFIDGNLSTSDDRYVLSLSLIDAKSGVILWAKTAERRVP